MGRVRRVSAGIDQTINPKVRAQRVVPVQCASADQLRGRNLNVPVNGVRPDPDFANIIQTVSDAEQHSDQLVDDDERELRRRRAQRRRALWNPRRTTLRVAYWIARANNNFDGPFVVPPSGDARRPSGRPSLGDRRHRYQIVAELAGAEEPQRVVLARRQYRHAIQRSRPASTTTTTRSSTIGQLGIGRNSARTAAQATVTANLTYSIGLGAPAAAPRAQERKVDQNVALPQHRRAGIASC